MELFTSKKELGQPMIIPCDDYITLFSTKGSDEQIVWIHIFLF